MTYSCDTGYYLVGDAQRTCSGTTVTGVWSGTDPECLRMSFIPILYSATMQLRGYIRVKMQHTLATSVLIMTGIINTEVTVMIGRLAGTI